MNERARLSFWQIWNMSFGFLGIQFGWGLQMANMSAIYQFLGADEGEIPILWLAAPLTGLIVQPIIGYFSDRTWTGLGRRRPYFLVGAILASLALIAMPNSSALWMAAGLLWILDASVNVSMEPFRAFVGDLLPKDQRKSGFAMQSVLIGLGAVLSSALPFILTQGFGVSREATPDSPIPPAVKLAFYIGAAVFILAVLVTIFTTKEHPPEDMEAFLKMKRETAGLGHAFSEIFQGIGSMPTAMKQLASVQFFTWLGLFCMWIFFVPAVGKGVFGGEPMSGATGEGAGSFDHAAALAAAYQEEKARVAEELKREAPPRKGTDPILQMFGLKPADPDPGEKVSAERLQELIAASASSGRTASKNEMESPLVAGFAAALRDSADPAAAAERIHAALASARRYQEGTAWGGVCFSTYNLIAFLFAFVLLGLTRFLSAKWIHLFCLACGAVGLISTGFVSSPGMLLVSMVGVGIAWASVLSMPYAMLANVIPGNKMGFYMGVFNFFIVLPQILASVGLGLVVEKFLGGDAMRAVLAGGVCFAIASVATLLVSSDAESGLTEGA